MAEPMRITTDIYEFQDHTFEIWARSDVPGIDVWRCTRCHLMLHVRKRLSAPLFFEAPNGIRTPDASKAPFDCPGFSRIQEGEAACSICGCTKEDCRGCIERTGRPCSWVRKGLCSACIHRTPEAISHYVDTFDVLVDVDDPEEETVLHLGSYNADGPLCGMYSRHETREWYPAVETESRGAADYCEACLVLAFRSYETSGKDSADGKGKRKRT